MIRVASRYVVHWITEDWGPRLKKGGDALFEAEVTDALDDSHEAPAARRACMSCERSVATEWGRAFKVARSRLIVGPNSLDCGLEKSQKGSNSTVEPNCAARQINRAAVEKKRD